jgi:serine/threonine-protein phosphatase 4 regulatory subunit 4
LQTNNIELHKVGSQVFSTVATKELVDSVVFVSTFLTAILTHFENKNIAISNLWLETLMTSISVLPRDILKHKIMNIARSRGQLSQSVSSRQTCCHIIGKMANNSDPFW